MNGLLPIIRRPRRPLVLPVDAAPAVPPSVVELPPAAPLVDDAASAPVEATPEPQPKKGKRRASPAE
jgi:hypothetical protein